jgi:C1A family cysteine protease
MARIYGYQRDPVEHIDANGNRVDLLAKDPKIKDFLATMPQVSPGDVDLSAHCFDMDQRALSSCVGNGTVESVEMLNDLAGYKFVPLSRLFIYDMCRIQEGQIDEHGNPNVDQGTHIRQAFNVLATLGVCDEYLWPYSEELVFKSPTFKAQRQATGHKIHAAYRIDSTGDARVADVIAALRANHPVVFGTGVTQAFEDISDATPIGQPGPNDKILGGHCMVIVGYVGGNFKIKNSWGKGWAAGGFCFMKPDYIAWDQTTDLWVPTLGVQFAA